MESTLSGAIDAESAMAQYDAACKRLLSEKSVLAWILKDCVEEFRDVDPAEIAARYIEGTPQIGEVPVLPGQTNASKIRGATNEDASQSEGTVRYDIRFLAAVPGSREHLELIINVEAQNAYYPGYPLITRALYYCARLLSAQYGVEFSGGAYQKIKKVYSIWICMNPPVQRQNTITRYGLRENSLVGTVREDRAHYDLLTAVMVCLGKEDLPSPARVLRLLNVLLRSDRDPADKKKVMQEEFGLPMTEGMQSEVSLMCNLSKGILDDGIQIGRAEGRAEGRVEGRAEERARNVQMFAKGAWLSYETVMDLLGIMEPEERRRCLSLLSQESLQGQEK